MSTSDAIVLSLYARKGGVGRTLLTQNLAAACHELECSTLVIDTDSQGSISKNFLGASAVDNLRAYQTVAGLFQEREDLQVSDLIHPTKLDHVYVLPANDHLEQFDRPVGPGEQIIKFALRDFLNQIRDRFHLIIIDTPPNVSNLPAWAALIASDVVASPVQPEKNSCEGIIDVKKRIARILNEDNPSLHDLGYIVSLFQTRSAVHRAHTMMMKQMYGTQIFGTVIKSLALFKEAQSAMQGVCQYKPKSREAEMIRELLREIAMRMRECDPTLPQNSSSEGLKMKRQKRAGNE